MTEIKKFAEEVIPKSRFIFDNYKTSQQETSSDRKNSDNDYFSFFGTHEQAILRPESNFKNVSILCFWPLYSSTNWWHTFLSTTTSSFRMATTPSLQNWLKKPAEPTLLCSTICPSSIKNKLSSTKTINSFRQSHFRTSSEISRKRCLRKC